jgi:HSP20 family protein
MSIIKKQHENKSVYDLMKTRMEDVFDDFFGSSSLSLKNMEFSPKVDVKEDEKSFKINAELPGLTEKDVNVELRENILTISGQKKEEKETKTDKEHRVERNYGSFSRSFTLPKGIETEKISAKFKNGILSLIIPKGKDVLETKKIKVDVIP